MYYEYWGLQKPPFDNVPDPSMYVDCHISMENAIAETLFGIKEGDECIAVIVGDVGLGKTLSLRMIIDSLDPEKYKIALITNPAMSFIQLLKEIIGQITGKHCSVKKKIDLLEIFNNLIFDTENEGKRILIFIDEANAIAPANLENLRLLTNMQMDQANLFTIILAGQIELAHRLEHPKRANLFQRVGTYSRIDKMESPGLLRIYVESRLRLAGGVRKIFTDDAISALWEQSDYGVPRLINKIAKLSLKAAETNDLSEINDDVINQIGERCRKLTRPADAKRKPRKKVKQDIELGTGPGPAVDEDMISKEVGGVVPLTADVKVPSGAIVESDIRSIRAEDETVVSAGEGREVISSASVEREEYATGPLKEEGSRETEPIPTETDPTEEITEIRGKEAILAEKCPDKEIREEIVVGQHRVEIHIPAHVICQAHISTQEKRVKMAGVLAARILQENPHVISSHLDDPVHIWGDIRKFMLNKL